MMTIDHYRKLSIAPLVKCGIMERPIGAKAAYEWKATNHSHKASIAITRQIAGVSLDYTIKGERGKPEAISDLIPISETPCNYGGVRYWFKCPSCNHKRLDLYGGRLFRCRDCRALGYECQTVDEISRLYDRGQKIAERMTGQPYKFGYPFPARPIGMHHRTYDRLKSEFKRLTSPAHNYLSPPAELELCRLAGEGLQKRMKKQQRRNAWLDSRKKHKRLKPAPLWVSNTRPREIETL